jgi:hypothetical protein
MKQMTLPYYIPLANPPRAIRKAKLDNIALVPASLLSRKGKYQTIANNLPGRGVLICRIEKKERTSQILERVAVFFRLKGHFVKMLPIR